MFDHLMEKKTSIELEVFFFLISSMFNVWLSLEAIKKGQNQASVLPHTLSHGKYTLGLTKNFVTVFP